MSNLARYKLLHEEYDTIYYIRLPFSRVSMVTVSLPLIAFIFCVVYSIIFNFESVNNTHCNVYNFLPSISAAIGSYSPQREVWTTAIFLHSVPRICIVLVYYQYLSEVLYPHAFYLIIIACTLNTTEVLALVTLSFWTSTESYSIHKKAFITFIITSEIYMLVMVYLFAKLKKYMNEMDRISLNLKKILVIINVLSILIATYCFIRHNHSCEAYVYSLFALCEYIVVLTNMAFHMTSSLDFKNRELHITNYGISLSPR